jgi:hypothetical protein
LSVFEFRISDFGFLAAVTLGGGAGIPNS